jgi:membrane fusion protein, multidrug efflux system
VRQRLVFVAVAFGLLVAAVYFLGPSGTFLRGEAATSPGSARSAIDANQEPRGVAEPRPALNASGPSRQETVQVVVEPARQGDVPIYLSGIGTVIAFNTVDTKALVDGVILKMDFQEGQDVKIGDPLVTIDPTPYAARVEQWQAAKQRAEALLANAKTNLWRDQQLLAHNYATQKQTDAEDALVAQYTADIAEDEAQIKFAQYQLDNTIVRSQINGRTGIRHVDPGNLIRAQENINIVTVTQLQPISVLISIPSKDLAEANISQGISDLQVLAYAQNGRTLLDRGRVLTVNNVVDSSSGTVELKATFPNARYKLWPGDFTDCKVMVEKRRNGVTVPTAAIHRGPKGDFVWVVRPDGTADAAAVVVKQTLGDTALIDQGVAAGDQVVTEGHFHLQSGSRVEVVSKDTDQSAMAGKDSRTERD